MWSWWQSGLHLQVDLRISGSIVPRHAFILMNVMWICFSWLKLDIKLIFCINVMEHHLINLNNSFFLHQTLTSMSQDLDCLDFVIIPVSILMSHALLLISTRSWPEIVLVLTRAWSLKTLIHWFLTWAGLGLACLILYISKHTGAQWESATKCFKLYCVGS